MLSTDDGNKFGEKMCSEVLRAVLKTDASMKAFLG